MNLINKGDILESISKLKQKGIGFFLSKATFNKKKRTQSTFGQTDTKSSNWWIIPEVKARENKKISGNPEITFDRYLIEKYLQNKKGLKLLSVACGLGNREMRIAESNLFDEVHGIDLSSKLIEQANNKVKERNLKNTSFEQADFYTFNLKHNYYDIILFHSALHHFKNINLISKRINQALKDDGLLVLNEYVGKNRLQFKKGQLSLMNHLLSSIPAQYKQRFLTNKIKKKVYSPGLLRMIISDPSEAVESETIIPIIHENFKTFEEKRTGGDLLMMVLKDIAHNFLKHDDHESRKVLKKLFKEEDKYLEKTKSPDFIFGVYGKLKHGNIYEK